MKSTDLVMKKDKLVKLEAIALRGGKVIKLLKEREYCKYLGILE